MFEATTEAATVEEGVELAAEAAKVEEGVKEESVTDADARMAEVDNAESGDHQPKSEEVTENAMEVEN